MERVLAPANPKRAHHAWSATKATCARLSGLRETVLVNPQGSVAGRRVIEDAQRWQQAEAIRAFLHAQEANVLKTGAISDQQSSHLAWARAKADWLDPLLRRPDAVLDQKIDIYY